MMLSFFLLIVIGRESCMFTSAKVPNSSTNIPGSFPLAHTVFISRYIIWVGSGGRVIECQTIN